MSDMEFYEVTEFLLMLRDKLGIDDFYSTPKADSFKLPLFHLYDKNKLWQFELIINKKREGSNTNFSQINLVINNKKPISILQIASLHLMSDKYDFIQVIKLLTEEKNINYIKNILENYKIHNPLFKDMFVSFGETELIKNYTEM